MLLHPLEVSSTPLWLSVVLAAIALVAAASSIVVGLVSYRTAAQQRRSTELEASANRRFLSSEAERTRLATAEIERASRLAVQRQAAFTQALEDLFEWSKVCHLAAFEQRALTAEEVAVDEREAANLARLRLLASESTANAFNRAWFTYRGLVKVGDPKKRSEMIKAAKAHREAVVAGAQRDLGVDVRNAHSDVQDRHN